MGKKRTPQLPRPPRSAGEDAAQRPQAASSHARAEHLRRLTEEGAHLLAARRPGEAAELLAEAWELDPQNAAVAINLGSAHILQGKHDRAVPVLEAAVRLEPANPMVWTNLAAAYLGKLPFATPERQDRAIAAFEKALALDPRTPHVNYNLGLIFMERGDTARAETCFRAALDTDPTDRDALRWLDVIRRGDAEGRELQG